MQSLFNNYFQPVLDKQTPFYSLHQKHNAKLISFAGYTMPIQYEGVSIEHNHVRNCVGVFDVSHMGQILIKGSGAFDLVQKLTTNNILKLDNGKAQYSCMLNIDGGIIDDLLVYRLSQNSYMLVVNGANAQKDLNWICDQQNKNVSVVDITNERCLLAIQGPQAHSVLQKLTPVELTSIPYYSFKIGRFADCDNIIISNTGYTGAGGFEIYFDKQFASTIWDKLFSSNDLIKPIGLAARDTLRLEMGYCLYGNDINESRSPIEAGLSWIVSMQKDFIGKDVISKQLETGVQEKLVGFLLEEKGIPRKDYKIYNQIGDLIGSVTSGTMSPFFKKGFGMGYVIKQDAFINNTIFISIRNRKVKATIIKPPFYEK